MLDTFVKSYRADAPRGTVSDVFHDDLGPSLHRLLHDLYDRLGTGKLADGLFELIDPRAYQTAYAQFFGGDAGGRVPFLLNGFGEPVAYKRIGPREAEVSILHTYGPSLTVLALDVADFFDRVLLTDDGLRQVINVPLYQQVRAQRRKLHVGEVYGFDPQLLAEEGERAKASAEHFEVVEASAQLKLLYQRASVE